MNIYFINTLFILFLLTLPLTVLAADAAAPAALSVAGTFVDGDLSVRSQFMH